MFLERAVTVTCHVCDYRYGCRPALARYGMRGRGLGTGENVIRLTPVRNYGLSCAEITEITMLDSIMCIDFVESHNHTTIFHGHCQIVSKADEKYGNISFMPP
jgi:hypothetical protein